MLNLLERIRRLARRFAAEPIPPDACVGDAPVGCVVYEVVMLEEVMRLLLLDHAGHAPNAGGFARAGLLTCGLAERARERRERGRERVARQDHRL